ncbi:hypothetical protein P9112_011353 [Eukaryota sp. TZLM1-RC]
MDPGAHPYVLSNALGNPLRLTGDYSGAEGTNDLTVPDPADLPKISDVCEFLSGNKYIATLDLPKAFWQLNLHPDDQEKSAIAIPGRKIKYTRAAFGLKNVPAVFQNLMKGIFDSEGVFIYMDDIIVAASTKEVFLHRIDYFLSRARRYRVRIGLHKCSFQTDRHPIKILGTIFEDGKRRIDPSKIETVRNLAPPTSVPELRSFTGSINFLRDWLPSVSKELAPLTALLKNKPRRIKLGPQELQCFNNIKDMVINSLPLALPDPDDTILVSTDASDRAIAGIVWKELEPSPPGTCPSKRKVMPVSFYSRILTPSQQRWSTLQKELFAIVMTLNQPNLSSYLLTKHLTIFCDHKNLAYLFSCPDNNRVVLRWIPVLQSFSFDCVHNEGTKNYWADYLSRANYVETVSKKKKKKRRRPEVSARSPLWNYLNLDDLTHSSPHWYDIDFDTARRTHHPSALRPEHSVTAYLNSRKHFIQYNLNPEPHELLSPSSARLFVLSTDLPLLFNNTIAPRDFGKAAFDPRPVSVPTDPEAEPLGLYARNFKVNDLVQHANWNFRIYFHHPKMPHLDYLPKVMPLNAHLIIFNYIHPDVTLGSLINHAHIFHLIPLPTHMVPFSWERNRHLTHRYHFLINQSYLNKDPPPLYFPSLWKRADQSSRCFHDSTPPPCSPRECPNSPKCDHFPWIPDTHTGTPFGEQLYDFCLHPTALTYSDLRPSSRRPALTDHQTLPDSFYAKHTLPSSRDITSFIPLCLIKPEIHSVYHYDDDEITPCPIAIPCLEMVHGLQIDPHDRRIHYHYLPLDYRSVLGTENEPQFILETSQVCSHFEDIRSLLFDGPTQYHSRLDFVLRDKVLDIIDYSDGRQAFVNVNRSPDLPPAYYLPSSRFHLPTRKEIFELHPEVFDHPRFLRSQFMSEDDELDRRFSSDSAIIEISSDSDSHHVASLVHSLSESPASSDLISNLLARNSPTRSFLDKLFKEQQKIPDSDPLFVDCKIEPQLGLKLTQSNKILVPPSLRSEILLLVHGSTEASHPPFAQCWKSLQQSDFHWPDMRNDLQTHVNTCIPCQKTAPVPKTLISSTGSLNSVRRPFESLHCDSIDPCPLTPMATDIFILVPTKDLKALTVDNSLISSVYAVFGAPRCIHSDNGPEFANKIFSLLCQFLNVEHTQSLPHYHQSNGLVERQHRSFLQVIRRMLLDFSDYLNWSDYVALCQMVLNSQERKALNASPYSLIFGSDTSPRLLPNQLLTSFASHSLPADKPEFIEHLHKLTEKLISSWEAVGQSLDQSTIDMPEPSYRPQVNDRVFVLRQKPDKLHGHYVGPYTVQKILSSSSILVLNPVTRSSLKTSVHFIKPCYSSLPPAVLDAYAAADSGEAFLDAILDISSNLATVLWSDGTTTKQPVIH